MPSFDAIVVGGGTNGLAAAGRLAMAGRRVLVVERAAEVGGAAATVEFAPGYRVSAVAHLLNLLDPRVEAGLALQRHGLGYAAVNLATTALAADGDHLVLEGACGERLRGLVSDADRAAWAELRARLMRQAAVLRPFRSMPAPRPGRQGNDLVALARIGWGVRGLGQSEMRELLRMLLTNVADAVEEEIADDRLKGALAFDAVLGAWMGPRSPNSLMLLYNRLAGEAAGQPSGLALPQGGMGAVALAMRRAVEAAGVEIRTGVAVRRIVVAGDRAAGVEFDGGEMVAAREVVSAVNPRTTFLGLVGAAELDTGFVRRVGHIRMRGTAAKLHLALRGAPDFRGADLRTRLLIAPSVDAVEAAFNPVKYDELPERPVMEIVVPSAFEAGLAPEGGHVLSAVVQFVPSEVAGGWEAGRVVLMERCLAVLEEQAPGIRALVVAAELVTPADLEARYGMIGGNWHHGELAVEQMLFLRPVVGAAQHATPVPGLWLAGAGCHPGGGVSGAAGWNAAGRMLEARA